MKKTFLLLGIGTGMLVSLTSCQSAKTAATGGYEEATPMSELAIADGELPPWVLESDDIGQISAGETTATATARNQYAIPEPGESSGVASQNQPAIAAVPPTDDTIPEFDATAPDKPLITHTPVAPATSKPAPTHAIAANTGSKSTTSAKKKQPAKVDKPTLVVYKVRPGDNLSDIAKRSGTTVAQIRKDSGIKGDIIRPGQTIKVRYTPKNYSATKSSNGSSAAPATAKGGSYTVKAGDTISAIAKKNGISTSALLAANGMTAADASKLRAGRRLTIPGKATPTAAATKKSSAKKAAAKKTKKK